MKLAGAPISWGVNELPRWGHRMAPQRVLGEMHALGLQATELGPPGYLPAEPGALRELLDRAGLSLAAGFLAVVLHDHEHRVEAMAEVRKEAEALAAAGADVLVLAAALPGDTYDRHDSLPNEAWTTLTESLAAASEITAANRLCLALHPHAGTAIESEQEVTKLLETTDVDIAAVFNRLQGSGYDGWYVLEQDTALTAEPEPAQGPIVGVRQSLEFFKALYSRAKQPTSQSKEKES